ncbi:MAG: dioxygenase [Chloroflexota bacterium]|nr:dioxygenase [Chloroflexota bacterium]MDE3103292.1 dioxygenase [Chloroflexota bacterium]
MPVLYLGHGAPPLVDEKDWPRELAQWAERLPRPRAILVVSAHWESAPLTIGATTTVPLVYDFYGFPERYYRIQYPAPGAPDVAERVRALLGDMTPVRDDPARGLDHGAYTPLLFMYPKADVPVVQISLPTEDPRMLMEIGRRLSPLRDEGVLIMGSGFMTHSFDAIRRITSGESLPPALVEFDQWAAEALARRDLDALVDYKAKGPAARYAHPTVDHFVPLFIAAGASLDTGAASRCAIEGFWYGNSKRSVEFR